MPGISIQHRTLHLKVQLSLISEKLINLRLPTHTGRMMMRRGSPFFAADVGLQYWGMRAVVTSQGYLFAPFSYYGVAVMLIEVCELIPVPRSGKSSRL
jgi:hypothetical protein